MAEHESYLLRLWRAEVDRPWRARLEHVTTGEVVHFRTAEALACYLVAGQPARPTFPPQEDTP